tara:strand:- start:58 stop:237 length:180 start_codon:yes stop_codon:yes gene_type:complete
MDEWASRLRRAMLLILAVAVNGDWRAGLRLGWTIPLSGQMSCAGLRVGKKQAGKAISAP